MQTPLQVLTKYWGHGSFRPLQEDIIQSVLNGKDTLALLPTGGGKSICFQVPAMCKEGVCIVISPLIALMKDQVENLKKRGIPAIAIVSGMHRNEIDIALDNCVYGNTKFLYLSPERLLADITRERIAKMKVNLIAIDEAHCISQWGYDFRPPYLEIASLREIIPGVPFMALTATATPQVVEDIQNKLKFPQQNLLQKSFERKNLAYVVQQEENKLQKLLRVCAKIHGSAVVYVRNRKKTHEIAQFLRKNNIAAHAYHAGLDAKLRDARQQSWLNDQTRVMVATNAFGMGIDKPNVRFVVHMDLPDSLEAYFQEAGRGGRDEKKAYAVLLVTEADKIDLKQRVEQSFPTIEKIKAVYQALANYLQLAVGSGEGESYDFELASFARQYNFKPLLVFNALKFIEKEGYIALSEALHNPSRLHFIVDKQELYKFQVANKSFDDFIKLVLRSYSGTFENYKAINEAELAKAANLSVEKVAGYLKNLHQHSIISYLPTSNKPKITFLIGRQHVEHMVISKTHYTDRKQRAEIRMEAVLNYAQAIRKCRSQMLLAYFGEENAYRCGVCDVCLERNKLELSNVEFSQVSEHVKELLKQQPLTLEEVVKKVARGPEEHTLKVIQWLLDNDKILFKEKDKLIWNK